MKCSVGASAPEQKKDIKRKMVEIWIISVDELKIWDINIRGKWGKDTRELSMLFFFGKISVSLKLV